MTRLLAPLRWLALVWAWDLRGSHVRADAQRIAAVRIAQGQREREWEYYRADPLGIVRAHERYVWRLHRREVRDHRKCSVVSFEKWRVGSVAITRPTS
jgi:hypothetical protein